MIRSDRHRLRVVIQRIEAEAGTIWRIVAYGDGRAVGHEDFPSSERVLNALRMAVPDFDEARLLPAESGSSILFAEEMELDEAQLAVLGVR
ncbi:MAG TPA: hypothetical protein VHZ09_09825 [Acidobacteriaceae bacterium]|nr:hypothetical protein [Acidobacteriaceae bacterium]